MNLEPGTILVVDDNKVNRLLLGHSLEQQGHAVSFAENGREALEKLRSERFDLVLLDIQMPEMDGYQVLEQFTTDLHLRDIPVIMTSALDELDSVVKCIEMGAEDYLVKPFDPQELLVVVRSRIGRAEAIREATEGEFEELKQQIITLLSHELRTPLTSVYGYTELALEDAAQLPSGEFQQYLVGIRRGHVVRTGHRYVAQVG